jgi:hypothetical protein
MQTAHPTFRELAQDFTFSAGKLHGRMLKPKDIDALVPLVMAFAAEHHNENIAPERGPIFRGDVQKDLRSADITILGVHRRAATPAKTETLEGYAMYRAGDEKLFKRRHYLEVIYMKPELRGAGGAILMHQAGFILSAQTHYQALSANIKEEMARSTEVARLMGLQPGGNVSGYKVHTADLDLMRKGKLAVALEFRFAE